MGFNFAAYRVSYFIKIISRIEIAADYRMWGTNFRFLVEMSFTDWYASTAKSISERFKDLDGIYQAEQMTTWYFQFFYERVQDYRVKVR